MDTKTLNDVCRQMHPNRNQFTYKYIKSKRRQRSGNGAIRKKLPLRKPRWEKTKLTIRYLC